MPSEKNIKQVEELYDDLKRAKGIYFTDYLGLNVEDMTVLRREFFENGVKYKVAKNSLLKLAAEKNALKGLNDYLNGSTAIAYSFDDPISPARVLKKFTKDRDLPDVKGIVIDGDVLDGKEFKRISNLPSKEELLSKLVMMLNSPLSKLVWALKSPLTDVTNLLSNLKEKESKKN
tara:strand:- start:4130 stop:4654 length:525 start_codon:yes stop_codon:yes gene_type:complete